MTLLQAYRIREIEEKDLHAVLEWRNSDRIRRVMYTDHIITMEEHTAWFRQLMTQKRNRCLICAYNDIDFGVVNITQWDENNQRCHWGFYVGNVEVPPGSGTAMGYLAIEYMIHYLGVRKICGEALVCNEQSIRYHKKLGFSEEGHFKEHVRKGDRFEDVIAFALFREKWEAQIGTIQTSFRNCEG